MFIVGLTGGVASGKTTVARILHEEGAHIIDLDRIARALVQPHGAAWKELVRFFGEEILEKDGTLHRKKLASIVFSHPDKRRLLNQVLHPLIKEEVKRQIRSIRESDPEAIVVVDAPLLVETGDHREVDKVIVVASTEAQQGRRLMERDRATEEDARKIISSQLPLEEKLKVADFVIRNDGPLEETEKRTKEIFRELKKIAFLKKDRAASS